MTLLAFGLNHATAPIEVREKVNFGNETLPVALAQLTADPGVREAAILSTCNRTEVYCYAHDDSADWTVDWLSGFHGCKKAELRRCVYTYPDADAVKHVLRVASGLDSMVVGEPQVLGQLKHAYSMALETGSVGKTLNRLFQHSFKVAKDVRSNTRIGNHPVSVASATVRLTKQIFGALNKRCALLIGAGDTIELAAKYLSADGLRKIIIANRTVERAQRLARRHAAYSISLAEIPQHLDEADIIISATAGQTPVLGKELMAQAVLRRKHKPMFVLDIAVPRDVEPEVGAMDDVYLYTVDDLKGIIDDNMRSRRDAVKQAEQIIDAEVARFMDWVHAQDAVATIRALRAHADCIREDALRATLQKLERGAAANDLLQELARVLTNKLIHTPTSRLNRIRPEQQAETLQLVRELFDLDTDQTD